MVGFQGCVCGFQHSGIAHQARHGIQWIWQTAPSPNDVRTSVPCEKSGRIGGGRVRVSTDFWFCERTYHKRRTFMRNTKLSNLGLATPALVALSILIAPIAKAECGAAAHGSDGLSPALRSLQEPAPQGGEANSSQAASP